MKPEPGHRNLQAIEQETLLQRSRSQKERDTFLLRVPTLPDRCAGTAFNGPERPQKRGIAFHELIHCPGMVTAGILTSPPDPHYLAIGTMPVAFEDTLLELRINAGPLMLQVAQDTAKLDQPQFLA